MFLRRNRDETIRDDPIHTSNLVHSRVIDMAPSATEEGEAEIMSDAKKKEKKVWSKPPKLILPPSPVFEQSRRFKSRLDTGYFFMAPKIKCQSIFKEVSQ